MTKGATDTPNMKDYSDKELIAAIKKGGSSLNAALQFVYYKTSCRESFLSFVRTQNGSIEEAEDFFIEGLYLFYTKIQKEEFKEQSSLQTYLIGICKNLWLSKRRQESRRAEIIAGIKSITLIENENPGTTLLMKEKETLLEKVFNKVGEKCKDILSLSRLGYNAKEIAKKTGYKNENVVGKKKSNCIRALRELMLDEPNLVKTLLGNYHE